jgi:hypothetical protein
VRERFETMTVRELIQPPRLFLGRDFVLELGEPARGALASCNHVVASKRRTP